MKWLALEIINIIKGESWEAFKGIIGKFKQHRLKKELEKALFNGVLQKYGNEVYYDDLELFLSEKKVFSEIIKNCFNAPIYQYKSRSTLVNFYVGLFIEKNPKHSVYKTEVLNLIHQTFTIVFNTLNHIDNESTRIICNVVKEMVGEVDSELAEIRNDISAINKKVDTFINDKESTLAKFDCKRYFEYIVRSNPSYSQEDYIERKIYPRDENLQEIDALSVLLKYKKVILLGEAGYGKTYEAITLLKRTCTADSIDILFPVFLPLLEFGTIYSSIIEGISSKVRPFCEGNVTELVKQWLNNGKLILILDGIDDIPNESNKTRFVIDLQNMNQQYNLCYYFITSRLNRYKGEFDGFNEYSIAKLSKATISEKLRKEGIATQLSPQYYELFENPLFLNVGITILKNNTLSGQFNRNTLFERLIALLYSERSQQKGIFCKQLISYSEVILLLGEFAYNTFSQPVYSYVEFERQIISLTDNHDKVGVIASIISTGIFNISEKVTFTHKLFKEYCAAYYLYITYPLHSNREFYLSLIQKDEWKEVFIFIVGMFSEIAEQDKFLDFILENNLRLYVDCINAKSDLANSVIGVDNFGLAYRCLEQIFNTYTYIVNHYFASIKEYFTPRSGKIEMSGEKICIFGCLSNDGNHFCYWFDFRSQESPNIQLILEKDMQLYLEKQEENAFSKRRNFKSYGINLKNSGLTGDSGRKIGLQLIIKELRCIIENRMLIESKYLLCERVESYKKEIKQIKESKNLDEIQKFVESKIAFVCGEMDEYSVYQYGKIDLIKFRTILNLLNKENIEYSKCILPSPDQCPDKKNHIKIWERYSDEQKRNIISKFFYFHQLSYIEMVEKNFPELSGYFSRYIDTPYQTVVRLLIEPDWTLCPRIQFYDIASTTGMPIEPDIKFEMQKLDIQVIFDLIQRSYQSLGKTAHHMGITNALFTLVTRTYRSSGPLSDYVYESIRKSLKEIFHDI